MSTYVPAFENDVFISYAHLDNEPVIQGDDKSGWVHTFAEQLKKCLGRKLGQSGKVWIDPRLAGNEPVTPAIQEAVTRSASLLVIFSEGYLQSEWCKRERDAFLQAAGGEAGKRLFVVHLDDIERERWPEQFRDLIGFRFFEKEREDAPSKQLGWPTVKPEDQEYFDQLIDLSYELAAQLKEMRASAKPPNGESEQPGRMETSRENPTTATPSAQQVPEQDPPVTVFLAETSADLRRQCENLVRQLEQAGLRVLPEKNYRRSPESFQLSMEQDLTRSHLFVQLLGPYTTLKTDELPKGYEGLQLDVAEAAETPVMRWYEPDLDLEEVEDLELMERADVILMPFEEFKREVESTARKLAIRKPSPIVEGDALALIDADSADRPLAEDFCKLLYRSGIGYDTVDQGTELQDQADDEYDALVVVASAGGQDWTKSQIRQCRKVYKRNQPNSPVCAVYLGAAPTEEELGIKPKHFYFFSSTEEEAYQKFVEAVRQRVTAE